MQSHSIERFFNTSITINRKVSQKDDFGGTKDTWDKKYWEIPCRIYDKTGRPYAVILQGSTYEVTAKLACSRDVDLKLGDKIFDEIEKDTYIVVRLDKVSDIRDTNHIEAKLSRLDV